MARIDEHTKKFMDDVTAVPSARELSHKISDPIRAARLATRLVDNPKKAIAKYIISRAVGDDLGDGFAKEGSLDIIGLFGFMNDHYAREWWDWEPETLWKTIEDEHISGGTPTELKEALLALQVLVRTNAPFENWHIFEKVGHAFNMDHVDFSILQPLEIDAAALTMAIMNKIRPKQEYEPEVLTYIAACAREAGMAYLPDDMLPGVQKYLDKLNFDMVLRDSVKNIWENKAIPAQMSPAEAIQCERLREIAAYLQSGGF